MRAHRLSILSLACGVLVVPLAAVAAPASGTAASCAPAPMTMVQRRISEEAARGLPNLIGFVNVSQPIYQMRLVDAVAWLDADRERRAGCVATAALAASD